MELIKPSYQIIGQCPTQVADSFRWIEEAGRTCYKSEDKITDTSSIGFCQRMGKSGHHSVLEHSNLVIRTVDQLHHPMKLVEKLYARLGERMAYHKIGFKNDRVYIAGNYRAWWQSMGHLNVQRFTTKHVHAMREIADEALMPIFSPDYDMSNFIKIKELEGLMEIVTDINEIPVRLRQQTVRIICDRGVTHEIVRHRPFAYSQESTRYVNYKGGMQFIIPNWTTIEEKGPHQAIQYNRMTPEEYIWARSCKDAELAYQKLIDAGWKPQQARAILPNSLKTEIVCTGFTEAWGWLFHMRDSAAAHPQIREIMTPLHSDFRSRGWAI